MKIEADSSSITRKKNIAATHSDLVENILGAGNEYNVAVAVSNRYLEVKEFFSTHIDKGLKAHPGVIIDEIDTSHNDRKIDFDSEEFKSLVESIRDQGLLQRPVLTLGVAFEKPFLCVAGHRRIAAYKALGYKTIPVDLVGVVDEKNIRLARLSENLVRQDLKPLELAEAVYRLKGVIEGTTSGVARLLSRDRKGVTRLLKIAEWPQAAKQLASENQYSMLFLDQIAARSFSNEELIEVLKKGPKNFDGSRIQNKKIKDSDSESGESFPTFKDTEEGRPKSGESFPTFKSYIELRERYFTEKNTPQLHREAIIQFLKDNKINGWF